MGIIAGLISMFAWGCGDFLAAVSSRKIGNLHTLFWMYVTSVSVTTIVFVAQLSTFSLQSVTPYLLLLLAVAAFQVMANVSFYKGLEIGQVSIVSPIASSFAVITVGLSIVFYREALTVRQFLAVALVLVGIVLVSLNWRELKGIKNLRAFKGFKEALIAMMGWGISLFLLVPASKALGSFLPVYLFRAMALLMVAGVLRVNRVRYVPKANVRFLIPSIFIGLFDVVAFVSYSAGVSGTYASIVAPISGAYTMVTMILARVIFKERMAVSQIFGVFAIITGIVLVSA